MSTSPVSGLSAEAKEFVPISSPSSSSSTATTTATNVPLYVDENTVASIYPSDHQPLMIQTIYPMMITNSKGTDHMQFPEIEFHIQPSQQQAQFHIDSQVPTVTNGNSSTTAPSQIVLLPTTNSISGFYPAPQILYSPNEPLSGYYSMDYCEPSLINFSLQQPNLSTKSNRILSQQSARGHMFRQQHGPYRSSARANHRGGGGNSNRNSYYDYSNRRNGSLGRGNSSVNKRISSSAAYHSHDYNNYYHPASSSSSSRSRGYSSRSTQNHDDYRKDQFDYYDHDYHQTSQMNDDGTLFEFRPEDFPSLPNNPNQQSDKTPPTISTDSKPTSSWNAIVSSNPPRPHSTSPHSLVPAQDSRSDRSRSFNTKSTSTKKSAHQPSSQPNHRASKIEDHSQQQPSLTNKTDLPKDDNSDDGFIQTKQQHRRLKRRNKIKEEPIPFSHNDEETFPNAEIQSSTKSQIENDYDSKVSLTETFNSLNLSSSSSSPPNANMTKENLEITDTNITENNSNRSSSSNNNSSDTSDYDDAVDNFDAE